MDWHSLYADTLSPYAVFAAASAALAFASSDGGGSLASAPVAHRPMTITPTTGFMHPPSRLASRAVVATTSAWPGSSPRECLPPTAHGAREPSSRRHNRG